MTSPLATSVSEKFDFDMVGAKDLDAMRPPRISRFKCHGAYVNRYLEMFHHVLESCANCLPRMDSITSRVVHAKTS